MRTLAVCLAVAVGGQAQAQTPACDALSQGQQGLKREIFASLHPYDGCDETFEKCLSSADLSPVVARLATDICRQVNAGRSRPEIERAMGKRAQSMLPTRTPAPVTMDESVAAGEAQAPVRVVAFACSRCQFCKVLVPALHREVTEGSLKGKVRLYIRPFPLKDHEGSTEGGLAMLSAARLGRFWPMVLRMYRGYDAFTPAVLPSWAQEAGMDKAAFEAQMVDPANREALVVSKQEGIRNKVAATPTLFVDGRRYVYEMQPEAMVDVLQEAYEGRTR